MTTVAQLIEALSKLDPTTEVMVVHTTYRDWSAYGDFNDLDLDQYSENFNDWGSGVLYLGVT